MGPLSDAPDVLKTKNSSSTLVFRNYGLKEYPNVLWQRNKILKKQLLKLFLRNNQSNTFLICQHGGHQPQYDHYHNNVYLDGTSSRRHWFFYSSKTPRETRQPLLLHHSDPVIRRQNQHFFYPQPGNPRQGYINCPRRPSCCPENSHRPNWFLRLPFRIPPAPRGPLLHARLLGREFRRREFLVQLRCRSHRGTGGSSPSSQTFHLCIEKHRHEE